MGIQSTQLFLSFLVDTCLTQDITSLGQNLKINVSNNLFIELASFL